MPIYRYTAIDAYGRLQTGELEDVSSQAVIEFLQKQDLVPIKVEAKKIKTFELLWLYLTGSLNTRDKLSLFSSLKTLLKAGISLNEAVDILLEEAQKPILKKILTEAKLNLEKGQYLSKTFSFYPNIFPPLIINLLKAGEETGTLENSLEQISLQLSKELELRNKIKSAMFYPMVLILAAALVIMLLFTFVLPRLSQSFLQAGMQLPIFTRIILQIGLFFGRSPLLSWLGFIVLVWGFFRARKTKFGQRIYEDLAFSLPLIKNLTKKIYLARFTRTLSVLLKVGTPILNALEMVGPVVGHRKYKEALKIAYDEVNRGTPLATILKSQSDLFPLFVTNLIMIGERAGTMSDLLGQLADYYEGEVDNTLKEVSSIIEPILLLIMGLVVAFIALAVLMPIYQLVGSMR